MATIAEIRAKYPQYQDMSDEQLGEALHRKFYSDMPVEEFKAKVGLTPQAAQPAAPQGPAGVTGIGLVDAGLTGLRQGAEGLGGMFGDANQMQGDIAGWVAKKFGASPETQETVSKYGRRASLMPMAPTTEEIQANLTKPVIGEHYQPQTVGEEYMRTAGQFAPGALAGPGSLGRKAVMTAVPAVLSETAGQATKGTEYEPYARGAGAIAGGIASAGKFNPKPPKPQATVDDIEAAGSAAFKRAEAEGVMFNQTGVNKLRTSVIEDLTKRGFDPVNEPGVMPVLKRLEAMGKGNVTFEGLKTLRTVAQNGWRPGLKSNNAAISKIVERIDELVDAADPSTILMGRDPQAAAAALKEGRKYWHSARKLETVEKYVNRGEVMADAQVNADTAGVTKRQLKNLMLNEGKTRGFSEAEMTQLKKATGYSGGQRVLHAVSGLLPRDKLSTAVHIAAGAPAALATGGLSIALQAAGMGVGYGAQKAAAALSRKSVDELTSLISSGGVPAPVTQKTLQLLNKSKLEALVRAMIAAQSGENSAKANSSLR